MFGTSYGDGKTGVSLLIAFQHINGLAKLAGKVFRIGHLGDFNDLMLLGTLSGVEMGLSLANIPHQKGGVDAAMNMLKGD